MKHSTIALVSAATVCLFALEPTAAFAQSNHELDDRTEQGGTKDSNDFDSEVLTRSEDTALLVDVEQSIASQSAKLPRMASSMRSSEVEQQIARAFETAASKPPSMRRQLSCFDYLMMEPDDRYDGELSRRARENQFEGAHPCDPVLPPLYESPLNVPYAELTFPPPNLAEDAPPQRFTPP